MYNKEHQRLLSKYKLKDTTTEYEVIVSNILNELNIKYIQQKGFLKEAYTCYIADFYLPKPYKVIIEVDGEYHQDRVFQDTSRDKYFLEKRGIRTLRINNQDVINNLSVVKDNIINFIKR